MPGAGKGSPISGLSIFFLNPNYFYLHYIRYGVRTHVYQKRYIDKDKVFQSQKSDRVATIKDFEPSRYSITNTNQLDGKREDPLICLSGVTEVFFFSYYIPCFDCIVLCIIC